MLFFGLSFAIGIVALLAVQKMDIECLNPPARKRTAPKRQADARVPATASFVSGAIYLRQQ